MPPDQLLGVLKSPPSGLIQSKPVMTVKLPELDPVPPAVVTEIGPVVAPAGTVVVMVVSLTTVKAVVEVRWNVTDVAPVKPEPVMVTGTPIPPLVGVNAVTVGG